MTEQIASTTVEEATTNLVQALLVRPCPFCRVRPLAHFPCSCKQTEVSRGETSLLDSIKILVPAFRMTAAFSALGAAVKIARLCRAAHAESAPPKRTGPTSPVKTPRVSTGELGAASAAGSRPSSPVEEDGSLLGLVAQDLQVHLALDGVKTSPTPDLAAGKSSPPPILVLSC